MNPRIALVDRGFFSLRRAFNGAAGVNPRIAFPPLNLQIVARGPSMGPRV